MRRRYEEMTSQEIAEAASQDDAVVVVPFAATEQHGPHLPVGTDAIIADGMVETSMALLPAESAVVFLSTLRIGKSVEHEDFPGTLSYGYRTATEALVEIGLGLSRAGFRRIVVVSSHGGNTPVVDTAALELRRHAGLFVAAASFMRFGIPDGLMPLDELSIGVHGGAVETALMLHFRPDLVRREFCADFPSLQTHLAETARHLRAHGRLGFGWMASDLNPQGVVGDARRATGGMGKAIAHHQAARFAEFLHEVQCFDLKRLSKCK